MEEQRVYFVIDMKSFFASVECAERGLDPMTARLVVADEERTQGTVCLAVSPALKALGVKNRCRLFEVPKNLDFIIAPPNMTKYIEYAAEIYAIYLKYIDKNDIHVYSIDECFLDVTDYLKLYNLRARQFAKKLMDEIYEKLHIPSSTGIGTNLYLAKIALDITAKHAKDRIGWLTEEKFVKTLWNHQPLSDFWGISTGISNRLEKYGICDMEGIARADENLLYDEFGINAELLIDHAWGRETCLMKDIKNYRPKAKSVSQSQILPCNYGFDDAKLVMREMIQSGCYNLYKQGYVTSLFHIFVGYGDRENDNPERFSQTAGHGSRRVREGAKGTCRLGVVTNLYSIIGPHADALFDKIVDPCRPVRRIGYDFCELLPQEREQYDLFTDLKQIEKEKRLVESVLKIWERFGKNAVFKGLDLEEKATQRERNQLIGGHRSGSRAQNLPKPTQTDGEGDAAEAADEFEFDKIKIPQKQSARPKMNRQDRAKQFAPFDALKGLQNALRIKELERERIEKGDVSEEKAAEISKILLNLDKNTVIRATYFLDGHNHTVCGSAKIETENALLVVGQTKIEIPLLQNLEIVKTCQS